MNISIQNRPLIDKIDFTEDELIVILKDGRTLMVPLVWYPSLEKATPDELQNYQILGDGEGIHWFDLDEDLSVLGFLQGISAKKDVA